MRQLTERRQGLTVVNVARLASHDDYGKVLHVREKRYRGGKVVEGQKLMGEWQSLWRNYDNLLFDSDDERLPSYSDDDQDDDEYDLDTSDECNDMDELLSGVDSSLSEDTEERLSERMSPPSDHEYDDRDLVDESDDSGMLVYCGGL